MKINELIQKLRTELVSENKKFDETENMLRLKEVAKLYSGEDKVISFADIAEGIKSGKEEIKIMTGWTDLDKIIKGFRPQQVVVVSAPTKSGKTTWLMELSARLKEHNPVWLPFEESAEELVRKYIERDMEVPHGFSPNVMLGNKVEWIEQKIVEGIAKYNSRVIFIDHLDFIVPFGADNHSLRVSQVMRDIKGLAKKWNVVIFLISHLVKTDVMAQSTIEDIRGSSSIAQEADTVILLWREAKRENGNIVITNNLNVSVQANRRHGTTGNVEMIYDGKHFFEIAWGASAKADKELDSFKIKY